ncbi:HNH endonuclease, partial [Ralstonia pseudosolanacearum]
RISDAKVQAILDVYGSLDAFVQQVFNQKIPASHVERELGQAEAEASAHEAFNPEDMVDGRRKVIQEIVRRQGQPVFRRKLLKAYDGRCVVTDCAVEAVLEAAHIAPYLGTDSNVVQNGLLLRADIHTLFDLGFFRIAPDGKIHLHEKLLGTIYEQYRGQTIRAPMDRINRPSPDALALKYDLVL